MARINVFLLSLFLVLSQVTFILADHSGDDDDDETYCVYMIYVKTGLMQVSGTGFVSLELTNLYDETATTDNLKKWGGLMGLDHEYFQSENYPLVVVRIRSVTSTGPNSPCVKFHVGQYLIPGIGSIEGSGTITRDYCHPGVLGDSSRVTPGPHALSCVA